MMPLQTAPQERWVCPSCQARLQHPHCPQCGKTIGDALAERSVELKIRENAPG